MGLFPVKKPVDIFADGLNDESQYPGIVKKAKHGKDVGDEVQRIDEIDDSSKGEHDRPPGNHRVFPAQPGADQPAQGLQPLQGFGQPVAIALRLALRIFEQARNLLGVRGILFRPFPGALEQYRLIPCQGSPPKLIIPVPGLARRKLLASADAAQPDQPLGFRIRKKPPCHLTFGFQGLDC